MERWVAEKVAEKLRKIYEAEGWKVTIRTPAECQAFAERIGKR